MVTKITVSTEAVGGKVESEEAFFLLFRLFLPIRFFWPVWLFLPFFGDNLLFLDIAFSEFVSSTFSSPKDPIKKGKTSFS